MATNYGRVKAPNITLQNTGTWVQWKLDNGVDVWHNLVQVDALKAGEVQMRVTGALPTDYVQWKLTTEAAWKNLVQLSSLRGEKGDPGTTDHNQLLNRNSANQHSISSIIGLQAALANAGNADAAVATHNASTAAHSDIRTKIDSKQDKIQATGTNNLLQAPASVGGLPGAIPKDTFLQAPVAQTANTQVLLAPSTKGGIPTLMAVNQFATADKITTALNTHNTAADAHPDIRTLVGVNALQNVEFDETTGDLTFTFRDGTTTVINLMVQGVIAGIDYDDTTKELVIQKSDGTETRVPVTDLVDEYYGFTGTNIQITIDTGNIIKATIVDGSITEAQLATALQTKINNKIDKTVPVEQDNLAALNADGTLADTGEKIADYVKTADMNLALATKASKHERALVDSTTETIDFPALFAGIDGETAKSLLMMAILNANGGVTFSAKDVDDFVLKTGGTMTGSLTLSGAPTTDDMAANKKYVDDRTAESGGSALKFQGFIYNTMPLTDLRDGNKWYQPATPITMPDVNFPWGVYTYAGIQGVDGAWSATTTAYVPKALDLWANIDDGHGYYYFNGWNTIDFNQASFNTTQFEMHEGVLRIKPGSLTNNEIATNADIAQSKVKDLETTLNSKIGKVTPTQLGNIAILRLNGEIDDSGVQIGAAGGGNVNSVDNIAPDTTTKNVEITKYITQAQYNLLALNPSTAEPNVRYIITDDESNTILTSYPDYANMETINRITANNGTWTADRDGYAYCRVVLSVAGVSNIFFNVNGKRVSGGQVSGNSGEYSDVFPVKEGDIVSIGQGVPLSATFYCYFLPPIITAGNDITYRPVNQLLSMGPFDPSSYKTVTSPYTATEDCYVRGYLSGLSQNTSLGMLVDGIVIDRTYGQTLVHMQPVAKGQVVSLEYSPSSIVPTNVELLVFRPLISPPNYLTQTPVLDYSMTEQDTYVKWLDGKTIYQKTIHWQGGWTAASNNNVGNPTTLIPGATQIIDNLIIASVQGAKRMGRATLAEITATSILLMSPLSWGDSTTQNDITLWYTK